MLRAFGITDKGRVRPTNEDCFAIEEGLGLCVVADGLGGHNAGEVAAQLAVDAIVENVRAGIDDRSSGNLLRAAVCRANTRVLEAAITSTALAGMGTTIVAALVRGNRLFVAHVGDSRLYLLSRTGLRQLTDDDSWMATVLAQNPAADPLALQNHPMRNALTNVVGGRSRTDVHVVEEQLAGDELIVLTTDGVHGVIDDRRLEELLRKGQALSETAASVLTTALDWGSRDNCTIVVAKYNSQLSRLNSH